LFNGKTANQPQWFSDVLLCEEFGWSYDDLSEAPHWFVERALAYLSAKRKAENEATRKAGR